MLWFQLKWIKFQQREFRVLDEVSEKKKTKERVKQAPFDKFNYKFEDSEVKWKIGELHAANLTV